MWIIFIHIYHIQNNFFSIHLKRTRMNPLHNKNVLRGVVLVYISANLFNIWFNRSLLTAHICFCIQFVAYRTLI